MNRTTVFGLAIAAAIICFILTILYWLGVLAHHLEPVAGIRFYNFKHGIVFLILGIVALLFAAAMRPGTAASVGK
jgi:fumarate reductase subunit C